MDLALYIYNLANSCKTFNQYHHHELPGDPREGHPHGPQQVHFSSNIPQQMIHF